MLKVSTAKVEVLTVKALTAVVKVSLAVPEEEVRESAPVDKVKPLEAVRVPEEVIVPVDEVEILPDVVTESPVKAGERVEVDSFLDHNPLCPPDPPTPMPPEQVNSPVESESVHPVDPDPPAKLITPPFPGLMFKVVEATDAPIETDDDPEKSKVVELKVLVLMVELNVAALPTVNPPVLLKETAPDPEVVRLNPAVAISVEASRLKESENLSKFKESSVINDPDTPEDHDPLPEASETRK